ncbi:hypothetical protein [Actinoallomurus bryophytorum]|nr:hypothetical protein [Actinoallomurus bryophytorum]
MSESPRIFSRVLDGNVCVYDPSGDAQGVLDPVVVFPVRPGDEVLGHTGSADLSRAVYTTTDAVACVTDGGTELWRYDLEPRSTTKHGHSPSCRFSADGALVWVYRPDAMAGRGGVDKWVVLDAEKGTVVAQTDLGTVGHGAIHFRHPDGVHMLLDVGEGQDGSNLFRGALDGGDLNLFTYPWGDRALIDLAADGEQFMTIDDDQSDVAFHTYPDGEEFLRLPLEAFGYETEEWSEAYVEWSSGYLDSETAIVTIGGEDEDGQEWWHHYRVGIRTGEVGPRLDQRTSCVIEPAGDGSWLTTDADGRPVRRLNG